MKSLAGDHLVKAVVLGATSSPWFDLLRMRQSLLLYEKLFVEDNVVMAISDLVPEPDWLSYRLYDPKIFEPAREFWAKLKKEKFIEQVSYHKFREDCDVDKLIEQDLKNQEFHELLEKVAVVPKLTWGDHPELYQELLKFGIDPLTTGPSFPPKAIADSVNVEILMSNAKTSPVLIRESMLPVFDLKFKQAVAAKREVLKGDVLNALLELQCPNFGRVELDSILKLRKDPAITNARRQIEKITDEFMLKAWEKPQIEEIKAKWEEEITRELWEIAEQHKPKVETWIEVMTMKIVGAIPVIGKIMNAVYDLGRLIDEYDERKNWVYFVLSLRKR